MRLLRYITIATALVSAAALQGAEPADSMAADTLAQDKKPNLIQRVIRYFDDSNKPHTDKAFDVSFIGGPHYASDTKFGIGLVAAGVYRHDRADTVTKPSNVALKLDATTSGFFNLGFTGVDVWRADRYRLNYEADVYYVYTRFWGIGYDECADNANRTPYRYFRTSVRADLQRHLGRALYLGPEISIDYTHGYDIVPELWHYQKNATFSLGLGLKLSLDTRDNLTNPHRGVFLTLAQCFYPKFLGNGRYDFNLMELTFSSYHPLWRGATLADRVHGRLTYGNTPWGMMSTLGGSYTMRGYYEGRYRDKSEIDLTLELRQHVWRRNSIVVWGGVASIFSHPKQITFNRLLPNYGVGYRWEFKKDVNIRVDLGFGRGECGFILSINEAF